MAKKTAKKKPSNKKTATKKTATKKTATKKSATKKTATKKTATKKTGAKKTAQKNTAKKNTAAKKTTRKKAAKKPPARRALDSAGTFRSDAVVPERAIFEDVFSGSPIEVRAIGARLRRIALEALPDGREVLFGGDRVRGIHYYAEERARFPVCTIQPGDEHCNLYLKDGARMEDSLHLLVGSGDGIRHVKVHGLDTPPESVLRDFISQGVQLAQELA